MNEIEKAIESFKKRNRGLKNNPVCQDIQERVDKQNYEIVRNNLAISALEKQLNSGWILTKDRLPNMKECQKNDCRFIVTDGNRVYGDSFDYLADGYIEPRWVYSVMCEPIAWQELPEKYKESI